MLGPMRFANPAKLRLPLPDEALPGRATPIAVAPRHAVLGTPMTPPFPDGLAHAMFGFGCFWGAERKLWQAPGVWTTAVGYAGGLTPNPTYEEVCSGRTGHNEVVRVVYDPAKVDFATLLGVFWDSHDPTQGMQQGGDVGTQYRSGIYTFDDDQRDTAELSRRAFGLRLTDAGFPPITTELVPAPPFYYAEDYHQQYLHKNPGGYCAIRGTGVSCAIG